MEWKKIRELSTEQLHYILKYFDLTEAEIMLAKETRTKTTCFLIRSKCPLQTYKIVDLGPDTHAMYIDESVSIAS